MAALPTLPGAGLLHSLRCPRGLGWDLMAQAGTQSKGTSHGHRATRSLVTLALVQPAADWGRNSDQHRPWQVTVSVRAKREILVW